MEWLPISRYARPTKEWDYSDPKILVYSPSLGVIMARCILEDREEGIYSFRYDRSDFVASDVTHWMPLPKPPQGE